jgi:hypothetical protein
MGCKASIYSRGNTYAKESTHIVCSNESKVFNSVLVYWGR